MGISCFASCGTMQSNLARSSRSLDQDAGQLFDVGVGQKCLLTAWPFCVIITNINQQDKSFHGGSVMKRFMFLSIGVLCLAIAVLIGFYVGSQQAKAQAPRAEIVGYAIDSSNRHYVLLANGDVFIRPAAISSMTHFEPLSPATLMGNYWSGVKEQFKK